MTHKMKKENKNNFRMIYLAIAVILAIAFIQNVSALGITPGRAVFDYSPGRQEDVNFKIINNEQKDMKVQIYVEGELNQTVTLYQKIVEFKSDELEKEFKYTFNLPEILEGPGIHQVRIIAMEIPEKVEQGTFIGATVAVATELYIKVPYPGKYLDLKLDIQESDVNDTTKFVVAASNFGDQKVARAYAIIDVLSKTNEKIASIKTDTVEIDVKQRKDFAAEWKADVGPGAYLAKVTVIYDDKIGTVEKVFNVGTLRIDLVDVVVDDFRLGGIAKFTIVGENRWNSEIKEVYSRVLIYDAANKTIADSKSASVDFPALEKTTMFAFWDTAGIDEGDYDGKIVLYYANKTTDREIRAKVRAEELNVEIVGLTANVVGPKGSGNSNFWLIAIVITLILINIAWFLYFKNKIKRKK